MDLLKRFTDYLYSPHNNLSKRTVKNYKADLNSFLNWYKKQYNLALSVAPLMVTSQIVESYKMSKNQDSNLSSSSLNRHLSSLRKFFKFLKSEGTILEDPFEQMKILQKNSLAMKDKWQLLTFRNYLYLHNKSNLTIKNYILDLRHFLIWAEQVTKENVLSEITVGIVNEYKKRLLDDQFSPRTINRKLSSIRKYLNWTTHESVIKTPWPKPDHDLAKAFAKETPSRRSLLIKNYSRFPPLRLMQKTLRGIGFLFDITLIVPFIKLTNALKPKPIFINSSKFELPVEKSKDRVGSYSKAMYAPLSISTRYFPWHKKAWHYMRHRRPNWYKKYHSYSIAYYFHLAILVLFASQLGFVIYQNTTQSSQNQKSVLGTLETAVPRILSFRGKLTNNSNNAIIVSNSPVRMSIYNDETATGSSLLWQEVVKINTDSEGRFSATLGNNIPLPQNLFAENQALWLGVAIGESPELTPREQLASVSLAYSAQKLQGLSPITSPLAGTKNVVLALDSSGNLTIDSDASPTFQATGGTFKLLGQTLVLSTTPGTNSNVEIAPADLGKIDLQKPIFNSTNNNNIHSAIGAVEIDDSLAVLATSSAEAAFTITQTSTGQLISAYKERVAKFAVDNNGDIISEVGSKWQPFSNSTSALNIANATGNAYVSFDTTNSRVGIGTLAPNYSLHINGSNAEIGLSASASDNVFVRWLQTTTERGAIFFLNSDSTFHVRSGSALALDTDNSNTPKVYITTSGNVGIGTTKPLLKLDVQDSQQATAAAQIFNTDTGSDADGLIVKLGTLTAVDKTNHFMSFETSGIGVVGSVRGDGATGVEFKTEGIADFAEYLKKDRNQAIEYGSVICIDDKGQALPCDNTFQKIIGVSSNQGGFTGGKDQGEESVRVGFVGQVFTKVSNMNGNINPGDPLTSSSIPGVGVKAVDKGQIIGKALEPLPASQGETLQGKILVSVNVSWYDPADLAKDSAVTQKENFKDHILAIFQDYMNSSKIISPTTNSIQVDSDIVSPLASNSTAHLEGTQLCEFACLTGVGARTDSFEVKTSIDNASVSAALEPDLVESQVSTLAAQITDDNKILRYEDIKKDEKESPNILVSQYLNINTFPQGLMAFGPTSLSDTSITGLLSIGAIILQDNSINTIGTDLELQPLRQGALSIMGGLVYIDTNGNLKVDGNAQFSKDITVGGDIIASGSGTFSKLNLRIAKNAFALSSKELIATGSAGTAFVRTNEREVTIKNNLVTDKSLIYVTLAGTPSGQIPFLIRQMPNISFTVGIASPSATNTPFNWLIIN